MYLLNDLFMNLNIRTWVLTQWLGPTSDIFFMALILFFTGQGGVLVRRIIFWPTFNTNRSLLKYCNYNVADYVHFFMATI